ncbi:MAG: alcohol dehydrogenase catalytic domain-containing protein, partial [Deltaproteobacteria bacterium]|nr:alcohol dehydrogenase catalytic domain-containing protein [Deltaproteobacteria bacterium]
LWIEDGVLRFREDLPAPAAGAGEALVRVRLAGICGTDLELLQGYAGFRGVPGHEFVGEVVEAPDRPSLKGRRVVGEINAACGRCPLCARGLGRHCESRRVLGIRRMNGAFADYLVLPAQNLHAVPETVPDEAAVFVEPLAAALRIQEQVAVGPGDRVLVVGAGRIGQLAAGVLFRTGCDLRVAARHPNQHELLAREGIVSIRAEEIPVRSMDVVVEAAGSEEGLHAALEAVRPCGTLVLKSSWREDVILDLGRTVVDEITLQGSRCGPFPPALELLASKAIDPRPMIAAVYSLRAGETAFSLAARPEALKILLRP